MPWDHETDLRAVRLGATLAAALPGAAAVLSGAGWSFRFGPPGHPRTQLPTCHLRAGVATALATGDRQVLGDRFGAPEGPLAVTLELDPAGPVIDVGGGVHRVDGGHMRHYVFATTLTPAATKTAVVQARTVPRCPATGEDAVADRLNVKPDPATSVTLVALADLGHPTRSPLLEDLAIALAGACLAAELTDEVSLQRR